MALDFDPRLDSSASASKRRKAGGPARGESRRDSSEKGHAQRSHGERGASKGKRKSVSAKVQAKAEKNARKQVKRSDAGRAARSTKGEREQSEEQPRRVGDIRRAERAERNRNRYRRYVMRIVGIIVLVLALVFGAIFLYRSDAFHVDNVQVEGVSHLTSNEITEIAAIPGDSTLLRLDSAGIISRLKQNAWVLDASVHREFPDTLRIDVTERTPGAVVRINDKSTWVISADGTWLSAATEDDWNNQMRIIDVSKSLSAPISGSDCNDGGIKNALAIISSISDDLKGQIESISAESSIKTSLNLKDGITVAFGDSSDVDLKEAAINALLEKFKGKISYINVRIPDRPTYRTLGS